LRFLSCSDIKLKILPSFGDRKTVFKAHRISQSEFLVTLSSIGRNNHDFVHLLNITANLIPQILINEFHFPSNKDDFGDSIDQECVMNQSHSNVMTKSYCYCQFADSWRRDGFAVPIGNHSKG
jgi:hypothetical protein